MSFLGYSKNFKGLADVFLRDPKRYLPFVQLVEIQMNGDSEFSPAERELIALHVSNINGCPYCIGSHRAVLKGLGLDECAIDNAVSDPPAPANTRMGPVLEFAAKLTRTPADVGQTDVDALRQAGWSDQAVEDAVGIVALFAFLNRLANGLGVEGSPETFEPVGAMISEQGYAPLVGMVQQKAHAA